MPKIVQRPKTTRPGRKEAYPWDEWLDGQSREFKMGKDFPILDHVRNWGHVARAAARRRGLNINANIIDDMTIVITAYKPEE